ncbi:MAG TPA: hypothetical protein VN961_09055, partial [Streptosporangiaceae bacterium]|nr:hypothetical protein [Streptosporangiaceae bacterium]
HLLEELFGNPALISRRPYRETLSGFLRDPDTSPEPLRRLAARDSAKASMVFAKLLNRKRGFSWDTDGEQLLRRYKPRYFDGTLLPRTVPLSKLLFGRTPTQPLRNPHPAHLLAARDSHTMIDGGTEGSAAGRTPAVTITFWPLPITHGQELHFVHRDEGEVQMRRRRLMFAAALGAGAVLLAAMGAGAPAPAASAAAAGGLFPQAINVRQIPGVITATPDASTACVLPDGTAVSWFHCYTPQRIRAAYGVDSVAAISVGGSTVPNYGQGQTIVLVDAYGSPTATADLRHFHDTFFPALPAPDFQQLFPQGNPQFSNTCASNGLSGPCAAANWSGEATLDIEWAYAIAPLAHIVLLAVPPAETLGVQGFPNLFNAISGEIDATPPGTLFSMSLAATEQAFGGAAAVQTAMFDQVFKAGLAKHDNFFAASGDFGSLGISKVHKESGSYPNPAVWWPASSPYVVSVGGTQLQDGWTWNPSSNEAFTSTGAFNPAYWAFTNSGHSQAVWNESFAPIGTGGGASLIYPRPSWQQGVGPGFGDHRLVP